MAKRPALRSPTIPFASMTSPRFQPHSSAYLDQGTALYFYHFPYPPTFLFFTFPLGMMPYSVAFPVWITVTLLLYLAAIYAIISRPTAVIAALTLYPVVWNVRLGRMHFSRRVLLVCRLSLSDIPRIPGPSSAIFRLIEAHRNEIQPQPTSLAAKSSGFLPRRAETRGLAFIKAHLCLRRLSHLTPLLSCRSGRRL